MTLNLMLGLGYAVARPQALAAEVEGCRRVAARSGLRTSGPGKDTATRDVVGCGPGKDTVLLDPDD